MTDFKALVISLLLAGLFAFAMISFAVNLAEDNGSTTILESEIINRTFNNLQANLSEVQSTTEAQKKGWYQTIPVVGEISVILETIVEVGKGMTEVVRGLFSLLAELVAVTLGIGEESAKVVMGIFTGILIFSLIILAWSVYRSGK